MTQDDVGAYYEVELPDGTVVSGTAVDEEHAKILIRAIRQTDGVLVYTCEHCPRGVAYSQSQKRWYHALAKGQPTVCPGRTTKAFPAAPKSRDRPSRRPMNAPLG